MALHEPLKEAGAASKLRIRIAAKSRAAAHKRIHAEARQRRAAGERGQREASKGGDSAHWVRCFARTGALLRSGLRLAAEEVERQAAECAAEGLENRKRGRRLRLLDCPLICSSLCNLARLKRSKSLCCF